MHLLLSLVILGRPSVLSLLRESRGCLGGTVDSKEGPTSSEFEKLTTRQKMRENLKQPLDPPGSVLSAWAEPAKGLEDGHLDQERI